MSVYFVQKHIHKIALAVLLVCAHLNASAQVVNFDSGLTSESLIPNSYAGLNWDNFFALDTSTYQASGYVNGTVSPNFVAYNGFGNPATFSSASPFTFNSAYLTSAWNDGLNVVVDAYLGSTLVHSASFMLNTAGPVLKTFNWGNIDSVVFTTSGGVPNPAFGGAGTQLAMDNLSFTPSVPESSTYAMLLVGLGVMGVSVLRKKCPKFG
jgi:hypothetical protein